MEYKKNDVRLVSIRSFKKDDKTFNFVKIADKMTFENDEFILAADTAPETLTVGTDYDAVLVKDGKFSSLKLIPVKVKA